MSKTKAGPRIQKRSLESELFRGILDRSIAGCLLGCTYALINGLVLHYKNSGSSITINIAQELGRSAVETGFLGMLFGSAFGVLKNFL